MFHILAQQEKKLFGPPRILMQENSFQPTPEWCMKLLFSLFLINFLRAPKLWSFQRSLLWATEYAHGWPNIISSMGTSQLSASISSARSLLSTSCSPGLPSTSVNASDYITVVALLFLSQPPWMSVICLVHSTCTMFWKNTQLPQPSSLSSPPQAQHTQQNSSKPCLPTTASLLTHRID